MARTLLIVDDNVINRMLLKNTLGGDYEILEACDGEEALDSIQRNAKLLSAVLMDIVMPKMDGYEVLRRVRDNMPSFRLPIIMVTGSEDEDSRVKALTLGANDFIMKPLNPEIVKHCVKNNIALYETESSLNALQRDKLTGLYSRDTFFEKTRAMVSERAPGFYTMASFDVDKFKVINDQYGTEKGDEVLRNIAHAFQDGFGPNGGICSRVSADNFAAVYPSSFQGAVEREVVRNRSLHVDGLVSPIIFCIGQYVIDDVSMAPAAMYDRALLAAGSIKGRYDARIATYDEAMREHLIREQEIVMEMESALKERQFEVWFQPQYNHSTEAMIGAEALVRWRHPQKGLISPGVFIPVFEQNGFIYSLDRFVWEEVCRYLRKWLDEGRSPLPVSVNISRYDVFRPDLVEAITGLVIKYRLPMELLRLEITESAFSESSRHIVEVVKQLVGYGFTVELDDFGSGYSSLNTLKDVPAQILKLDMKFLEDGDDSSRGGNIVESIVRMAKWLGMSVIAEGVETLQQADYLRSIGCSYLQGYLYARPMEAAKYEAHCRGVGKEERLLTLETVDNLDNNAFWDPGSMDTLIFNSYVGGACIYEYHGGKIEMLRATEKYARVIGADSMTVEEVLRLDLTKHLDEESRAQVARDLEKSVQTRNEITSEYVFLDLPGCPHETCLRSSMRVIASAGERYLVYCTSENITAQRQSEKREREVAERMQAIMRDVDCGVTAAVLDDDGSITMLFTNDKFYEIHGYTREQYEAEVTDKYRCIHPDDREKGRRDTISAYTSQTPAQLEYRLVCRDGSIRWVSVGLSSTRFTGIARNVHLCIFTDITAQKQTEQEIRNASEQTKSVMDDMPGGFVRVRVFPDGSVKPVYFNEGLLHLTAMSHDELMALCGDDVLAAVHPDDVGMVRRIIAELLTSGETHRSRYRLRRGDGGYLWLSTFERATRDACGNIFLNIYYTDATEQIQAEERQRELLDNLPGGAGLYELAGGKLSVVYLNKSYWELVGRTAVDYAGMLPMSAVHPDDMAVLTRELATAIENKRDVVCDIRLRHETSGYCPVHLVGRIVPNGSDGIFIYTIFAPIDHETASYQQMLPLLLSALMESTTDFSFAKDRDLRYLTASRAFANMVGKADTGAVIGKTDYDLFPKEMADKFRKDDEALLANGQSLVDTVEPIPSKDGAPRYSSTSKYLLLDGSGEVIGLYGTGRDVTEVVEQNSQLKLVNDSIPGGLATYVCTPGDFSPEHIKITYFNDGFCRLFGFTRDEYLNRASADPASMVFREDHHIITEQWLALMKHGTPINCLYRAHVKDGGYKWISHKAVASERRNDLVVINAILQDVTDQRELIEQLRISEEENNLAVRLGGNVICRYLIADKTLTLSPDAAVSYSLPEKIANVPEEPIRLGMISPESVEAYTGFFEAILHGSKAASAIFQQKYFGVWRWMEAKSSTIFSDDGKPVKAVISFYDVTERLDRETIYKKWQQSLTDRPPESYMLFRCNMNNDASYALAEGTLLAFDFDNAGPDFNTRAKAYIRQCVFPADRDKYTAFVNSDTMLASYYRGKRSDVLEYRELMPNGSARWLRLTVDLVEYPNSTEVEAYLMYENIDEAKKAELQTRELSETDPLTGLLNRTTFAMRVERIIHDSMPEKKHALLMLDIDGFKQVNDVFGHGAGDQTLIDLAYGMRAMMRRDDLVARLGGDEFLVFLNDVPDDHIVAAKAKQLCALARKAFSLEVQISGSVGIAIVPRDGMNFETLYKKADSALYYVKGSGKNGHSFYNDGMAHEHLEPEADAPAPLHAQPAEKKRRMLIVDDNVLDYALLQNMFRDEFIIEKAKDGNTALIRLRHYGSAISVVLLDLVMPGMDGFAVLEKMQASAELQAIPVIIVSGDESRETCLEAIRKGATDFITKPVDPEVLHIRVRSAVSKAENERLRAKNCLLEIQNDERIRYETALESMGIAFIEYNWLTDGFFYYPTISHYLAGVYDGRKLWDIFLSDGVADEQTIQEMQRLVHSVAKDRASTSASAVVRLKTPQNITHSFRLNVRRLKNECQPTNRLMISLIDLNDSLR